MVDSVVQLEYDSFCRAFLSPPHIHFRPKRAFAEPFAKLKLANDFQEDILSQDFITAVITHHLTPGSTLTTTLLDAIFMNRESKRKIQAGIYRSSDVPKRGHPHWADQKVSFQFSRYVAGLDPFTPSEFDEDYTETGRERKKLREHVYATADLLFAAQHRVFLFMVLIIGRRFRLLRWDRAGVIVTPSVDYVEQSALLCDCLRRLALLDDVSLGFDPTATRLRPRDPDFMRMDAAALDDPSDVDHTERRIEEGEIGDSPVFRYVRSSFRDSLSSSWPRHRLRVQDRDDTRDYLVGKPVHLPSDVIGRGTRGYVALDCNTDRFVWLKDAWRACDLVTEVEGDVLGKLNSAGVANVPTLVCQGHVQDQTTVTDEWWEITRGTASGSSSGRRRSPRNRKRKRDEGTSGEDSSSPDATRQAPPASTARPPCPLRRHTHYRIAVEEVAMPATEFRCGKQLASITLDCLRAHHQAATDPKTRLLHRDISSGNMLICPKVRSKEDGEGQSIIWTGILTDWELAKPIETGRSLQANRVGTHQFMSVNLLCDPFRPVAISDELESFFHVLVYLSVRYLRSNCPNPNSWISNYFLASGMPDKYLGGMKTVAIQDEGRLTTLVPPGPLLFSSPMDRLLSELLRSFTAHYKVMAHDLRQSLSPSWSSSSANSSPGADKTGTQAAAHARPKPLVVLPSLSDDPEFAAAMEARKAYRPPDTTPTPEDRELARRVADHDFMSDFIAGLLSHKGWSDDDRIPVRSAPSSDPHPEPEPEPEPETAFADKDTALPPKRRRKAAPKEKATRAPAQTARRPTATRQTRSQTRAASSKTRPGRG